METLINMSPIMPYIILIVGFVLLIKGADIFVDGCSSVAKRFNIPTIIIGLTITAFGTSAPEAAVSITSSIKGANAMAVSNVIGSNIFNLLMVVGVCAIIKPIKVSDSIIKRDYPINVITSTILVLFCVNFFINGLKPGKISRLDGILLIVGIIAYVLLLIKDTIKERKLHSNESEDNSQELGIGKSIMFILVGAGGIALGGNSVVSGASAIARSFNISDTLIGLTIVALGTSLPELVTSIVASTKNENDLAVGNVVGSNIFNVLFVLGSAAAISPIDLAAITNPMLAIYDCVVMLAVTVIINIMILIRKDINRIEGAIMVTLYASYLAYIIIR
ncbi:MAG: calcium/sodium antiporter [Lachnospiraceae bacterium]|nr:calcium/sodium antiporter [Lachnospiraceae bacterium]